MIWVNSVEETNINPLRNLKIKNKGYFNLLRSIEIAHNYTCTITFQLHANVTNK